MASRSRRDALGSPALLERVFLGAALTILRALLSRLVSCANGRDAFEIVRAHRIILALGRRIAAWRLARNGRRGLAVRGLLSAAGA